MKKNFLAYSLKRWFKYIRKKYISDRYVEWRTCTF